MPSKNDLSAIKLESTNTLVEVKNKQEQDKPGKAWRKPKPINEKQSEKVTLQFTIGQMAILKQKTWLVPIATYLKDILERKTNIFKKPHK